MATKQVERGIYMTASGYQIKCTVKGVPFNTFVLGHDNLHKARSVLAQAKSDMHQGLSPEKQQANSGTSTRSLQYAYDETWKHQWSSVSDDYATKVGQYWKCITSFLVDDLKLTRIDKVTAKHVDEYVYHLSDFKGNSGSTINNKLGVLSAMFKLMHRHGVISIIPKIKWQETNGPRLRYYTHDEEQKLLELCDLIHFYDSHSSINTDINTLLKDFTKVLFATGMRPWMEAHNIQRKWIRQDSSGNTILTVPKKFSKTNKERSIPITGAALEVIWRRSSGLEKDERLFARLDYRWHCKRFWKEVVRPNMGWGDDEVWYGIRHTFATRLCELNVNLKTVQELMGHTNINQTAQYAKATDDAKADAILKLSGMTGRTEEGESRFQMFSNDEERSEERNEERFPQIRAVK